MGIILVSPRSFQAQTRHTEILGHLLYAAKVVAAKEGIEDGFRVVVNNGPSACKLCKVLLKKVTATILKAFLFFFFPSILFIYFTQVSPYIIFIYTCLVAGR